MPTELSIIFRYHHYSNSFLEHRPIMMSFNLIISPLTLYSIIVLKIANFSYQLLTFANLLLLFFLSN